ncbi:MAG: NUDIX hydrolase [Actinomycetota bacterium]
MTTNMPACGVGAIVLEKGELLLVKRDREPSRGLWSLPGGRVEWGESMREAIVREVREETNIDIDVEGVAGFVERIVPNDEGEVEYHYIIVDFWARPRSHEPKAGDDVSDARWVNVANINELQLTPGLYEFLQDRGALEGRRPRA